MKSVLAWLVVVALAIAVFAYYGRPLAHGKLVAPAATQPSETDASTVAAPTVSPENQKMVTMAGPLAQWMEDGNSAKPVAEEHRVWKAHASDHVEPSPVGTSTLVAHKTFAISNAVNFPFEIPAHAVDAHLKGNYRSFVSEQKLQTGDGGADVSLLLMNQDEYAVFMKGGSPDVLLNLDPSHDQDVNFGLPASRDLPVKYYLVFVNNPREGKKIVQANFKVDF